MIAAPSRGGGPGSGARGFTRGVCHALSQPARLHRPARLRRAVGARLGAGLDASRNDRDPDPPARRGGAGGAFRKPGRRRRAALRHAGAGQPVRHRRARRHGHGAHPGPLARGRRDPGLPAPARTAGRLARGGGAAAPAQVGRRHAPAHRPHRAGAGSGSGRRRCRPVDAAGPDLLAGRAGAPRHLAGGGDRRPRRRSRRPLQSRRLPDAGDGAEPDADALAAPPRRRRAPCPPGRPRRTRPARRGGDRRRPRNPPRGGDPGAGDPVGIPVRRAAARRAGRTRAVQDRPAQGARARRDRARGRGRARRLRRRGPLWRPYGLLQRGGAVPVLPRHRDHAAREADLSLDVHRPSAGRAQHSRRGAERIVRAAHPPAVPGDRGFLAATGRMQLPYRRGCRSARRSPATRGAS